MIISLILNFNLDFFIDSNVTNSNFVFHIKGFLVKSKPNKETRLKYKTESGEKSLPLRERYTESRQRKESNAARDWPKGELREMSVENLKKGKDRKG